MTTIEGLRNYVATKIDVNPKNGLIDPAEQARLIKLLNFFTNNFKSYSELFKKFINWIKDGSLTKMSRIIYQTANLLNEEVLSDINIELDEEGNVVKFETVRTTEAKVLEDYVNRGIFDNAQVLFDKIYAANPKLSDDMLRLGAFIYFNRSIVDADPSYKKYYRQKADKINALIVDPSKKVDFANQPYDKLN